MITDDTRRLREDISFAAKVIAAFLQMGVCPHGYDRDDLRTFQQRLEAAAVTPQPHDDLDDIASDLWNDLCEGNGEHSERLDRALILKHLRRAAAVTPGGKQK